MSDVSVLSNQYETLLVTSDSINDAIIALKKQFLLKEKKGDPKYQSLKVEQAEIAAAVDYLRGFLMQLQTLLEEKPGEARDIPNLVADDYIKNLQTNFIHIRSDIKAILHDLNTYQALNFQQLTILDKVMTTLDGERKNLFRKLRSSRS